MQGLLDSLACTSNLREAGINSLFSNRSSGTVTNGPPEGTNHHHVTLRLNASSKVLSIVQHGLPALIAVRERDFLRQSGCRFLAYLVVFRHPDLIIIPDLMQGCEAVCEGSKGRTFGKSLQVSGVHGSYR